MASPSTIHSSINKHNYYPPPNNTISYPGSPISSRGETSFIYSNSTISGYGGQNRFPQSPKSQTSDPLKSYPPSIYNTVHRGSTSNEEQPSPSVSGSIQENKSVFPPTDDMKQKAIMDLKLSESSFKIIYAGDVSYKPDKGLLSITKKVHLVLSNNQLLVYKSSQKARAELDMFNMQQSKQTAIPKIDKDRVFLALHDIYAVHYVVTPVNTFRIEYLHVHSRQSLSHLITAESAKECQHWIHALQKAIRIHRPRIDTVTNSEKNNVIDRISKQSDALSKRDDIVMYKVVFKEKRYKASGDQPKEVFLPVIFAIGKFSFYFSPISTHDGEYLKTIERDRFGLLSIQSIKFDNSDDTVIIEVRQINKKSRQLVFATTFCEIIVQYLRRAIDSIIPPNHIPPVYIANIASNIKSTRIIPYIIEPDPEDDILGYDDEVKMFNSTLRAYCASLNLNKNRFNFSVNGPPKAKSFVLHPPNEVRDLSVTYTKYELIAILRSLAISNFFQEISLRDIPLSDLESWNTSSSDGWSMVENHPFNNSNVLSNEIYDILINLNALRKLDLSNCQIGNCQDEKESAIAAIGLIMSSGKTSVSRLCLGRNNVPKSDMLKLVNGIKEHKKSIKELYLDYCNLTKEMSELVLKTLAEKNPEQVLCLDLSIEKGKEAISPDYINPIFQVFRRLVVLRLRGHNILDDNYKLSLEESHLKELDLGDSRIDNDMVTKLCKWIRSPSFLTIEALHLGGCNLNGRHVYDILTSISQSNNRVMHLNLENNPIMKEVMHLPKLHSAFSQGEGPTSISFARLEWDDPTLREFIDSLRDNQTVTHLDLSDVTMKDTDIVSQDTIKMLSSLFERNSYLKDIKLNFKYLKKPRTSLSSFSRPIISDAITSSLIGLRHNTTLEKIDLTGLGMEDPGALALAHVLKTNRGLKTILIDENNITIEGYRSITKSIEENANQVIHFPTPKMDHRNQLKYLVYRIEELIMAENEAQFFLIHTSGGEKKREKKHELEMMVQERKACELATKQFGDVIRSLEIAVSKNLREYQEQYSRSMELQLQAQAAAQEMAIAQVRIQGRAGSVNSFHRSQSGSISRQNYPISSSASITSSNSSINNSRIRQGSITGYGASKRVIPESHNSPPSFPIPRPESSIYTPNGNILGQGYPVQPYPNITNSSIPNNQNLPYPPPEFEMLPQSSIYPHKGYNEAEVQNSFPDFGYVDDFEYDSEVSYMYHTKPDTSRYYDIQNEEQLAQALQHKLYLPPDTRD
ncbi:RNI-like protein [Backusella circina FSU 941]|nr:RNI-like protein [Backusella circina FSU 941]